MSSSIRVTSVDGTAHEVVLGNGQRSEIQAGDRVNVLGGATVSQVIVDNQDVILILANGERVTLGGFAETFQASAMTALVLPEPASLSVRLTDRAGHVSLVNVEAGDRLDVVDGAQAEVLGAALPRHAMLEDRDLVLIDQAGNRYTLGHVVENGMLNMGVVSFPHVLETAGHGAAFGVAATADVTSELSPSVDATLVRTAELLAQVAMSPVVATQLSAVVEAASISSGVSAVEASSNRYQLLVVPEPIIMAEPSTIAMPTNIAITVDDGRLGNDLITTQSTVTLTGQAIGAANVIVTIDGSIVDANLPVNEGLWTLTDVILSEATHQVSVEAVADGGQDVSAKKTVTVTRDNTGPDAPTVTAFTGDVTNSQTPLTGQAEAGSEVFYSIDGAASVSLDVSADGDWSVPLSSLSDAVNGLHSVTVVALDAANNVGTPTTYTFTLDTVAPAPASGLGLSAATDSGKPNDDKTNDASLVLEGTRDEDTTVTVIVNGSTLDVSLVHATAWSVNLGTVITLDDTYAATVVSMDPAGNLSTASTSFTFDTSTSTPTAIAFDTASDSGTALDKRTNVTMPSFHGEAEAYATVNVTLDGVTTVTTADMGGHWTTSVTSLTGGADVPYTVTVTSVDEAGNASTGSGSFAFNLDTVAPVNPTVTALTNNLTNDATPTLSGTAEAGSQVVVLLAGGNQVAAIATGGIWSVDVSGLPSTPVESLHTVSVYSRDAADNTSTVTSYSFTLDTIAPTNVTTQSLNTVTDSGSSNTDNLTNNTSMVLEGTAEVGTTVKVIVDGDTLTANLVGSAWTVDVGTAITTDGTYAATVSVADLAGNLSTASTSFTLDTTPHTAPTQLGLTEATDEGLYRNDDITSVLAPVFEGKAHPDSEVTVTLSGMNGSNVLSTVTYSGIDVDATGSWSTTLTGAFAGTNTITSTTTDLAGNVSAAATALIVKIDTDTPDAPTGLKLVAADDSGRSSTDNITQDKNPTLEGMAEPGSQVRVNIGANPVFISTANNDGLWSVTTNFTAANATYTASVSVVDLGGNASAATSLVFTVDNTNPSTPTITSFGDDSGNTADRKTNDTTPTFYGQAEALSLVTITENGDVLGSTVTSASGLWTVTTSALAADPLNPEDPHTHSVTIHATDRAGNTSNSTGTSLTIDTSTSTPTAIAFDTASDSGTELDKRTNVTTPSFHGEAEAYATVNVTLDGVTTVTTADMGGHWTTSVTTLPGAADAPYTVTVISVDQAGNTSSTGSFEFTLDTVAPAGLTVTALTNDLTNDTTPQLTGYAEPDSTVVVSLEGGDTVTTVATGGIWSVDVSGLPSTPVESLHTINVTATDAALNTSSTVSYSFDLDTVAPTDVAALGLSTATDSGMNDGDDLTNNTSMVLEGTAEVGTTVKVIVDGDTLTANLVGSAWTVDVGTAITTDGTYAATVSVADLAGNLSTASTSFTLDTQGPTDVASQGLSTVTDAGSSNTDDVTNNTSLVLAGTAEAGTIVTVDVNGTTLGVNLVGSAWTVNLGTAITMDGTYAATVTSQDDAGNFSTGTTTFTLDTVAPTDVMALGLTTDTDSGLNQMDDLTNNTSMVLEGTAEVGTTVKVIVDGDTLTANLVGSAWTVDVGTAITTDGTYAATVSVADLAGNLSTASTSFTRDTLAPTDVTTLGLTTVTDSGNSTSDNLTNNTNMVLEGTAEAGTTVSVEVAGDTLDATLVGSAWTVNVGTAIASVEGVYAATVTVTDLAGNVTITATSLTLDTTAPTSPTIASFTDDGGAAGDGLTNDATPTFSGRSLPGSTVSINEGVGAPIGAGLADEQGYWTAQILAPMSEGLHTVTVSVSDIAGNTSDGANTSLTIDTIAPAVPTMVDLVAASDSGSNTLDNHTNVTMPQLTGSGDNATTVTLRDGTTVIGSAAVSGGLWTVTNATLTGEGLHTISVISTDLAGNTATAVNAITVTLDTTAPTGVTASGLTAATDSGSSTTDNVTKNTSMVLEGTAEANSTVNVLVNGANLPATLVGTAWTANVGTAITADGLYAATITVTDLAGNDTTTTTSFTLDTAAPGPIAATGLTAATDSGSSNTDNVTKNTSMVLEGTADSNSTVSVLVNGTNLAASLVGSAWTVNVGTAITTDGLYAATVTSTDLAGNVTTGTTSFTLDTTAPTGVTASGLTAATDSGSSTTDNVTKNTSMVLEGTAEANSTVNVLVNGANLPATLVGTAWTANVGTAITADGLYAATITVTDLAGNDTTTTTSFTRDTAAPTNVSTSGLTAATDTGSSNTDNVTKNASMVLEGTAEANSTVNVLVNGANLPATLVGTAWTANVGTAITADGLYAATITVTDLAGNDTTTTTSFTLDTAAPGPIAATGLTAATDSGSSNTDNVTKNTSMVLEGTADSNSTVSVLVNGTNLAASLVGSAWTVNVGTAITTDGLYAATVTSTDLAGNVTTGTTSFTLDTTAPTGVTASGLTAATDSGSSTTDNVTKNTSMVLEGTAEANSTVNVLVNGANLPATLVGTAWTANVGTAITADGLYAATITVTDLAGNDTTTTTSFTRDTAGPTGVTALGLTAATDSGSSNTDNVTKNTNMALEGTAEAGSTVSVLVNGTNLAATLVGTAWTVNAGSAVTTDGLHAATITVTDLAGNDTTTTTSFTLDTAAPANVSTSGLTAATDSGSSNTDNYTNNTSMVLEGTAEAGSTVSVLVNGVNLPATLVGTAWTVNVGSAVTTDGLHAATVTVTDLAGNTTTTTTSFTRDTAGPTNVSTSGLTAATDSGSSSVDNYTKNASMVLEGTAESGSTVSVLVGGVNLPATLIGTAWTINVGSAVTTDGLHAATVTVTDLAGNTTTTTTSFTLDTTAPTGVTALGLTAASDSGSSNTDNYTNNTNIALEGTAEAGSTVSVLVGGVNLPATLVDSAWTINVGSAVTTDGLHAATVTVTDLAGNATTATTSFTRDTVAPTGFSAAGLNTVTDSGSSNSDNLTNNTSMVLEGTAEAGSTVSVLVGGVNLPATLVGTAWTVNVGSAVTTDGLHAATVTVTDLAGNTTTGTTSFTLDTLAPAASINALSNNYTNDPTPTLSGTADANSTVVVRVDGNVVGGVTQAAGAWTVALGNELGETAHSVSVTVTDMAGNSATTETYDFTVDTTAPTASTINVTGDLDRLVNTTNVALEGVAEEGAAVSVKINDGLFETVDTEVTGAWGVNVGDLVSADGTYTVSVKSTDLAGNVSLATSTFEVDTMAPSASTVEISGEDQGFDNWSSVSARPHFVVSANAEAVGTVTVTVLVDGVMQDSFAAAGIHTVSLASLTADLEAGITHSVSVTTTDAAGNATTTISDFEVVTGAPVTTEVAENVDGTITLQSDAPAMSIFVDKTEYLGVEDPIGSGKWTFPTLPSTTADVTLYTVATNDAGEAVIGAPYTVSYEPPNVTYRLLPELGGDLGLQNVASLTLDYNSLAHQQSASQPDANSLTLSTQDVFDLGANIAEIDLSAVVKAEITNPEGAVAEAGRQTADGIFTQPTQDFGFGADAMITANNPYLHVLEHGTWQ